MKLNPKNVSYDFVFTIITDLFNGRQKLKLTISEVSKATGLSENEIDSLELGCEEMNMHEVFELCQFYNIKLNVDAEYFKLNGEDIFKKYSGIFS